MTAYLRDEAGKTALKRKSPPKNPHQSAPIRISSSRRRSQSIWAEVLDLLICLFTHGALERHLSTHWRSGRRLRILPQVIQDLLGIGILKALFANAAAL
jgi:hypothetical protein